MKKSAVPLLSVLAAALLLTACATDGDGMWGGHHDRDGDHHDRDHHDDHLVGALTQPGGTPAPVVAGR